MSEFAGCSRVKTSPRRWFIARSGPEVIRWWRLLRLCRRASPVPIGARKALLSGHLGGCSEMPLRPAAAPGPLVAADARGHARP